MARKCFVIMPFSPTFDAVWQTIIQPTVTEFGDHCTRADTAASPGHLIVEILDAVRSADYLIADLTGSNPNVFYEIGFAHALGKPVVLLVQSADVPFDVRNQRLIIYDDTVAGAARLRDSLRQYLTSALH